MSSHDHHDHAGHAHGVTAGSDGRWLLVALLINLGFMVVEVVVGLIANSLALLSDAAHMLTDVVGLGMALAAIQFAASTRDRSATYGLYRLEVLASVANAFLLFGVAIYVLYEAVQRFSAGR